MRIKIAMSCLTIWIILVFQTGIFGNQLSAQPDKLPLRFSLSGATIEISVEAGRLVFQRLDAEQLPAGEPWSWPEEPDSPLSYADPRLVESAGETWLYFVESGEDGVLRSRAISLSEVFADGFESATTTAWSITEPAVNLRIESPPQNSAVNDATPPIRVRFETPTGIAVAAESLAFQRAGNPLAVSCSAVAGGAECVPTLPFADGPVAIEATVADVAGHVSPVATRQFSIDTAGPVLSLSAPVEGFLTAETRILVAGSVSEAADVRVGSISITPAQDLTFSGLVPLAEGSNVLVVTATDAAGNVAVATRSGISDTLPPAPVSAALVSTGLEGATVSIAGAAGAAEAEARVRWRNSRSGEEIDATVAADGSFLTSLPAVDGDLLVAVVIDFFDRRSVEAHFPLDYQVPPDPTPFAPPLDPTVAYDLGDAISFLYQGPNAIQKDVAPGAIEERRIAWLRGTVKQRGGAPLPGVRVTALGRHELGYTLTRADGVFDLVVNGGGVVTLDFERAGFLPVQRQEEMDWRDSTVIEDVVMIGLDNVATEIESGSTGGQIARSTPQDDGDGEREAILFFPPGTVATMSLPDGSTVPLPTLTVRATEYTVGEEGQRSMPGPLPDNVAYTYAVELSADEAIAARAERVDFSQPVYLYVDSFIPFRVGSPVPLAWYDRDSAAWIPADNGRVIEILAAGGDGLAGIDADGTGSPASAERLSELGFTDAERQQLASLYPPGHQIWRSPIPHFTPWDANYPWSPPDDAVGPPEPVEKTNDDDPDGDEHDDDGSDQDESDSVPVVATAKPEVLCGSILECENQIVRQQIPITGTPFSLAYSSHRTPGWGADQAASYEMRGATVPDSLEQISLQLNGNGILEGRTALRKEFDNRPFMTWIARIPTHDAFGRPVTGQRNFRVRFGYSYPLIYRSAPEFVRSWARFPEVGAERITLPPGSPRRGVTLWRNSEKSFDQIFRGRFGNWDGRVQKLGGFSIDVHHAYDPAGRTLYLGDGSQKSASVLSPTLRRVAGIGSPGDLGDGGPATLAELSEPGYLAFGPDGSLYISDTGNHRVRVVRPDGTIETIAGTGEICSVPEDPGDGGDGLTGGEEPPPETCDEGLPATASRINRPAGLAIAADGTLFFADAQQNCIRHIDRQGILRTVAGICTPIEDDGGGSPGLAPIASGQAGPATETELRDPVSVLVKNDDTLVILDSQGIGEVTRDGLFRRILPELPLISAMAAGDRGELYLLDSNFGRIFRVAVDGTIEVYAGGGDGPSLDGDPALGARLPWPGQLAVGGDGRLYFVEDNTRIRRIEEDGTLKTVGGPKPTGDDDLNGYPENGNFLLENFFLSAQGLAVGQGGRYLISDGWTHQVFESQIAYPEFVEDELNIAEGGAVLVFDRRGRHLRTRHAITGAVLYDFEYDAQGLLTAIVDGDSNTTTIEREAGGQATAIVSPFGQRTELAIGTDGWLESIENPNQEKHSFSYRLGLMTEKIDPRGFLKSYEYSDLGRLTAAVDEEENRRSFKLLGRFGLPDNSVILAGADAQKTNYTVRNRRDGSVVRTQQDPDRNFSATQTFRDGSTTTETRGIFSYTRSRPDPRLGESAAYPALSRIRMSNDLESETSATVDAPLEDLADPWSFPEIFTLSSTNGRLTTSVYTAASRNFTTISPEGRLISLDLDALARPIRFDLPATEPWTAVYRESGELEAITVGTGETSRRTLFGYDTFHRLEAVEDAEQRIVTFGYDDANRVTSTLLPDGKAVGFQYDENGNVTQVTPPGRPAHVFTYTPRNQLSTYTLPDVGTGPAVEERVYDDSKRLEEVRRPDGKVITFEYRPAGNRLEKIRSPRGETSFGYNEDNGLLAEIEEPDGQLLSFEYEGLLIKKTTWTGEVNGSVEKTYDENFRVKTISVNGENPIDYEYDDDNLLVQVGDMKITRDPESGRELTTQLGNVTTERTYTPFGEPETYTAKFAETEIYFERLAYNRLGWITDLERRQNGFSENLHYEYDDRGRLEEVWRDGDLESSYTYDDNSNRLSYTGPLGNATGTYDERDRMLTYGGASYTWTEAGELASKTDDGEITRYEYDVFGNLRKVELPNGIEIEYLTDGAQRRIGKKINGLLVKQWLYRDQLEPVAELHGSGASMKQFVYGTRLHAPDFLISETAVYRFLADAIGGPRLLVDSNSGAIAQELRFAEFGEVLLDTNPQFQPFGVAAGLFETASHLVRFGARDYNVTSGRWFQLDPIMFASNSLNLYEYGSNSPMNFIDPSGKSVLNCSASPVLVKPEDNTQPIGELLPGQEWPGSPDGVYLTPNGPWYKTIGRDYTPSNDVVVTSGNDVVCLFGSTCWIPFMGPEKLAGPPDPTWNVPTNPQPLPNCSQAPKEKCEGR